MATCQLAIRGVIARARLLSQLLLLLPVLVLYHYSTTTTTLLVISGAAVLAVPARGSLVARSSVESLPGISLVFLLFAPPVALLASVISVIGEGAASWLGQLQAGTGPAAFVRAAVGHFPAALADALALSLSVSPGAAIAGTLVSSLAHLVPRHPARATISLAATAVVACFAS